MLGCAIGPTNVVWSAWQPFERGYMLWRSDLNTVYALFNDGRWVEVPEKWGGQPIRSRGDPPAGLQDARARIRMGLGAPR